MDKYPFNLPQSLNFCRNLIIFNYILFLILSVLFVKYQEIKLNLRIVEENGLHEMFFLGLTF